MMNAYPHAPGVVTKRYNNGIGYNAWQEALWQIWADTYASEVYGYSQNRMPTPGFVCDPVKFRAWQQQVVEYLDTQTARVAGARSIEIEDFPKMLWLSVYERMLAINHLRPWEVMNDD